MLRDLLPQHLYNESILSRCILNTSSGQGILTFSYRIRKGEKEQETTNGVLKFSNLKQVRTLTTTEVEQWQLRSLAYERVIPAASKNEELRHFLIATVSPVYVEISCTKLEIQESGFQAY